LAPGSDRDRGSTTEVGAPRTAQLDDGVAGTPVAEGAAGPLEDDAWLAMVADDPALYLKGADGKGPRRP